MADSVVDSSETVFVECRALVFLFNVNVCQWCNAGDPGVFSRIQLLRSPSHKSAGSYRISGRLETSGKITLNIQLTGNEEYSVPEKSWHQIRTDQRTVYGLRVSAESDGTKFFIIVQNTLRSLQGNPITSAPTILPTGPPVTPMVAWGVHPNPHTPAMNTPVPPPSGEPVRRPVQDGFIEAKRSQRRREQEAQIDSLCMALTTAIQNGSAMQATDIVKKMASQKLPLSIKLKNPVFITMDLGEETISLKVVVEDKESSGGVFSIKVLPTATVDRLQQEVFDRYGFPVQVQKWIVGKKVPKPQDTLQDLGVTQSGTTIFLYLLSGKSVGLRRSDAEKLTRGTAASATLLVSGGNARNSLEKSTPVTMGTSFTSEMRRATSSPTLNSISEATSSRRPEPVDDPIPPRSAPQRNVVGEILPRKINDIRNLLGQQMEDQVTTFQTSQNTLVNNLLPAEQGAAEPDEPKGWQCPRCTLINPPTRPGCEACTMDRPADYVVPAGTRLDDRERNRIEEEERLETLFREAERRRQVEEQAARDQNFVTLLQTAQQSLIPNTVEFDCGICFVPVEPGDGVILRECLHSFCRECLSEHIRHATDPEVQCPHQEDDYACHATITGQEIKALLSADDFNKFLSRSLATAESQAANSFHCKTPNCGGWCVYEDNVNTFSCPVCDQPNCLTCKAIHDGMNCREYQDDLKRRAANDDAAKQTQQFLEGMVKNGDAMRCPVCQIILLKKDGCDWMRCSMCRTEICWATRGPRWGPQGNGDITGGCKCRVGGKKCHPKCRNCH